MVLLRSQGTAGRAQLCCLLPVIPGLLIIYYFHPSKNISRSAPRQRCVIPWNCLFSPANRETIDRSSRSWSSPCLCVLQCVPVPAPLRGSGWGTAAALVELLLRNQDFLRVGGGRGRLLGFGLFFFFSFLQNAFSSFNTRWFGTSPVLAKAAREAALTSVHAGIEAVSGEGFVSYGAFVRL